MGFSTTIRALIGMAAPNSDGAFTAPESALPRDLEKQHHVALMDAAREQLRQAHVARAGARGALTSAEERTRRALDLIASADTLAARAGEAEGALREAARLWAAAGCPPESAPDPALREQSIAAAKAADDARVIADGSRMALPRLRQDEGQARLLLGQAEGRVRDAAIGVLAAAAEPKLAELERLRAKYEETLRPIAALRHLARHRGPGAELAGFSNTDLGQALDKRFKELTPLPPADPDLRGGALDLRERALRLLDDPAATLEV